jgi:hypothetical protein
MTQSASIEQILDFLLKLARMQTPQLREALDTSDRFQLKSLANNCPFSADTIIPWLPARTPPEAAESFRKKEKGVILWYDHLSKAGGTSFCKLAQTNMKRNEVPRYYCMPRDGKLVDGRVGLWSNQKLSDYISKHSHRLVSNEWQPFPPERLEYPSNKLLFVTTIRDPLNRLLSAHRFWTRERKRKPTLSKWISNKHQVSREKSPSAPGIALHVARYNFITWKFSNGTMPLSEAANKNDLPPPGLSYKDEKLWRAPFEMAVRTLSKFDLVLITEEMTTHPEPIKSVLGWTNLDKVQVVSSGKVMNSDTASLSKEEYDVLWDANRWDIILYYWMKAVYLTRIQCSGVLV